MKNIFLAALITLTFLVPANAQSSSPEPPNRFELGWSPISYLSQNGQDLWGGSFSLAMRRSDRLSYVVDLSIHQTRPAAATADSLPHPNSFTTSAYRFGLRYYAPARGKFTPFGEVLAGGANLGARITTTITPATTPNGTPTTKTTVVEKSHTGLAFAAGGGADYAIKSWLSWRVVHVDYSFIRAGGRNIDGVRIQTGGVFRFGH